MTPESLVTSLATSRRLKEAGWDAPTYFNWAVENPDDTPFVAADDFDGSYGAGWTPLCAAPTLGEILEVLPDSHLFPRNGRKMRVAGYLYVSKVKFIDHPPYRVDYIDNAGLLLDGVAHTNPAEAAALLWLRVCGKEDAGA